MHIDTQVISNAIEGLWNDPVQGCTITSIAANELLLVYGGGREKARYYVPLLSAVHHVGAYAQEFRQRDHPFNKRLSDSIMMDFGNEHPSFIEYNNLSISTAINDGHQDLMAGAIKHLSKDIKKRLKKRFRFLVENEIQCVPITSADIEIAFDLLTKFKKEFNPKGNFRNTWNDLLILSSAKRHRDVLVTEDNLLSRFAAEQSGIEPESREGFLEIPYTKMTSVGQKVNQESKGYINNSWRAKFSRPVPFDRNNSI